jgi:hypothetical protein
MLEQRRTRASTRSYPLVERRPWHEEDGRAATQLLNGTKVGNDPVELGWAVGLRERKEHREHGARSAAFDPIR